MFEQFAEALIEECNRHTTSDFQERDELFSDAIKSVREGLGVTEAEDEQPEQPDSPPVPGRDADLRRWESTWLKVKGQVVKGKGTKWIAEWLRKIDRDLACHPDTLSKIIKAGRAGLLNRHH